jgi:hypothetical protein
MTKGLTIINGRVSMVSSSNGEQIQTTSLVIVAVDGTWVGSVVGVIVAVGRLVLVCAGVSAVGMAVLTTVWGWHALKAITLITNKRNPLFKI